MHVSSPQGRFAESAQLVDGQVFAGADAWGKHLVHRYRNGLMVHVHLGLYGRFDEQSQPMDPPVGAVRMRLESETVGVDLRGPTACEIYSPAQLEALVARLGPDPLRADADPEKAWAAVGRSARPIGALMMDQKVMAGVGNVYRAEVLFRARINPFRSGTKITREEFDEIWADLVMLMPIGVRRNAIHVIRDEDDHGAPSYRTGRPRTYVYRRAGEPCRICGTEIAIAELEARKVYWCPQCQAV